MFTGDIHQTLNGWAQVENLNALARKVLELPKESSVTYYEVAEQVNHKIQDFVKDNPKRFFSIDLPALQKIQGFLSIGHFEATQKQKKLVDQLKQIIKSTIQSTQEASGYSSLPNSLRSLCEDYSSIRDCINLSFLTEKTSVNTSEEVSPKEINLFVHTLRLHCTQQPHIFKQKVDKFFRAASSEAQRIFFHCIKIDMTEEAFIDDDEEAFFNAIIFALPNKLPFLNLDGCKFLKNCHLKNIVTRLPYLNTLKLTGSTNSESFKSTVTILSKLARLQNLTLNKFLYSTKGFKVIAKMPHLRRLNLGVISIKRFLPIIETMKRLQSLGLKDAEIDLSDTLQIASINNLFSLKLDNIRSINTCVSNLDTMTQLQSLSLKNNNLHAQSLLKIADLQFLKKLNLRYCALSKDDFKIVFEFMPHLEKLNLSYNRNLSNSLLWNIKDGLGKSQLQSLSIMGTSVTDEGAMLLVNYLKKLTDLDLSYCKKVTFDMKEMIKEILLNGKKEKLLGESLETKA